MFVQKTFCPLPHLGTARSVSPTILTMVIEEVRAIFAPPSLFRIRSTVSQLRSHKNVPGNAPVAVKPRLQAIPTKL